MTYDGRIPPWVFILFWCSMGYVMVMFNKMLISTWNFGFPFFLTFCHSLFATLMTQLIALICPDWLPSAKANPMSIWDFVSKICPIALFFSGGLVFGNSAYKYISVAYLQIMKSMTPVPTLLVSFLVGRETPTWTQLVIVLVICTGITIASIGELSFSWVGFLLQMFAMVCDISRTVVLDILLVNTRIDPLSTLYYMAPASALLIGIGFLLFEWQRFTVERLTFEFVCVLLLNASVAFVLNISVILLLGNTSPVIVSVVGVMKDILLVASSVVVFGVELSTMQIVGYSVSVVGLNLYKNYKQSPDRFTEYVSVLGRKCKEVICFGCITTDSSQNPLSLLIFLLNGASLLSDSGISTEGKHDLSQLELSESANHINTTALVSTMEAGDEDEDEDSQLISKQSVV